MGCQSSKATSRPAPKKTLLTKHSKDSKKTKVTSSESQEASPIVCAEAGSMAHGGSGGVQPDTVVQDHTEAAVAKDPKVCVQQDEVDVQESGKEATALHSIHSSGVVLGEPYAVTSPPDTAEPSGSIAEGMLSREDVTSPMVGMEYDNEKKSEAEMVGADKDNLVPTTPAHQEDQVHASSTIAKKQRSTCCC
jgi:hypothetical protein